MNLSEILFEKAKKILPGGVNSPVRAFNSVGGNPLFIEKADGSYIYDVDNNEYIDYVCSWGPMILGHNNEQIREAVLLNVSKGLSYGAPSEKEVELAELMINFVPNLEMVRMVNSGTEAVMSAIRLARGYTNRQKIIKFEGCYHGHSDSMLVKAGSGALTLGEPDSLGVLNSNASDTLIAQFNDIASVEKYFSEYDIACVIVEPVSANMGVVLPKNNFLEDLRKICSKNKSLLIFDEVITGFRLCKGGAQEYFGIEADLVTYGKIIGGGMPVGAYGGKKEIMNYIAPCGPVYQAGTLSGNPIAMSAGIAQLLQLADGIVYENINDMAELLEKGLNRLIDKYNIKAIVTRAGSLICVFFGILKAESYADVKDADKEVYASYFREMLNLGIYLAPSQYEAMFVSNSHSIVEIEKTLTAVDTVFKKLKEDNIL